ncbi:MAG: MFS transporter [Candidatus Wolframiiraptor sp. EX4484-121]|nr:MAG: MFS transporter [Candidatus Wolframiiraptor sp. EX4484-121]
MGLRGRLLATFISLSFVSLFADIVYEGARSIGGAYLNFLMAPAIAVGILGFGEFLSNLMRFLGGVLAQRMTSGKAYWSLIFIGYLVNLAIPCLAFTGAWEIAIMLFLVERVGKGLRAPARDVILSELTDEAKRGRWFGLHELLDQIGAIAGPAIIGASIYVSKPLEAGYRLAFNLLWIPVVIMIVMLLSAYMNYPRPKAVSATIEERSLKRLDKRFWSYLIGSILTLLGFIYWGVIAYYAQDAVKTGVLAAGEIPILYLIAMAVDAIIALPIGLLYDRLGSR